MFRACLLKIAIATLALTACSNQRADPSDKAIIVESMIYYLEGHLALDQRRSCIKPRILRKASKARIDQADNIYGYLNEDDAAKIELCPSEPGQTTYQIYEPKVSGDTASIDIDYHCGRLCGRGKSYRLQRRNSHWHVISRGSRWIS